MCKQTSRQKMEKIMVTGTSRFRIHTYRNQHEASKEIKNQNRTNGYII